MSPKKTSNYRNCSNNIWHLLKEVVQRVKPSTEIKFGVSIPKEKKIYTNSYIDRAKASLNPVVVGGSVTLVHCGFRFSSLGNIWQYLILHLG